MRRLMLVTVILALAASVVSVRAMVPGSVATLTTTSFTLHGSVAGGINRGSPGDVLIFSFVAKNTGVSINQQASPEMQALKVINGSLGDGSTIGAIGFNDCSSNGLASSGDGQGFCSFGSWPNGATWGVILSFRLGNVVGPASVRECITIGAPYAPGPCLTLSVKVI